MSGPAVLRFAAFELNSTTGELRQHGDLIKLAPQPFKVLELLVRRSGEVVTRPEVWFCVPSLQLPLAVTSKADAAANAKVSLRITARSGLARQSSCRLFGAGIGLLPRGAPIAQRFELDALTADRAEDKAARRNHAEAVGPIAQRGRAIIR